MRGPAPGRLKFGPERDQQQDRQACHARHDEIEQLARCRVAPLRIFINHQQRLLARAKFDLPQQRLKRFLFLLMRRETERRVLVSGRDRQKLGQEHQVLSRSGRLRERGSEFV